MSALRKKTAMSTKRSRKVQVQNANTIVPKTIIMLSDYRECFKSKSIKMLLISAMQFVFFFMNDNCVLLIKFSSWIISEKLNLYWKKIDRKICLILVTKHLSANHCAKVWRDLKKALLIGSPRETYATSGSLERKKKMSCQRIMRFINHREMTEVSSYSHCNARKQKKI